jgi:hypothetical protein
MWVGFNGSCYLFNEQKYDFEQARSYCTSMNSTLVSILHSSEQNFIAEYFKGKHTLHYYITKANAIMYDLIFNIFISPVDLHGMNTNYIISCLQGYNTFEGAPMIVTNELNISRTRNGNSGKKRAH